MSASPKHSLNGLSVLRLSSEATIPTRAHPDDAGLDLYALEDLSLPAGAGRAVKTGIALAIPSGFVGLVADRSSLAKRGIKTSGGIIDAGYRGEIHILLWNLSSQAVDLKRGERIAQILIVSIATPAPEEVSSLDETERGVHGFGSTGK